MTARYAIARWRSLTNATAARQSEVHWWELSQWLALPRPPHQGDKQPGWSPAVFADGRRRKDAVRSVSLLVLDADAGDPIERAIAAWDGTRGLVHTTRRHTPEHPRYRVVLVLARAVTPDEHGELWSWAERRCAEHGVRLDAATRDPGRFWFLPAGRPEVVELPGEPIDVDEVLERLAIEAEAADRVPLQSHADVHGDVEKRARAYVAKMPGAISGSGGHNATWAAALVLAQGFGLAEERVFEILRSEYNPRCQPPWTEAELRHKAADACNKAKVPHGFKLDEGRDWQPRAPREDWQAAASRPEAVAADRPASRAELVTPEADEGEARPSPVALRWQTVPAEWLEQRPAPRRWLLRGPGEGAVPGPGEGAVPGPGILPRGVVGLLAAAGGSGKTMLLTELAVAVATARPWLGHYEVAEPGRVLLALAEEDEAECRRRLWRACRELDERERRIVTERVVCLPLRGCDVALAVVTPAGHIVPTATHEVLRRHLVDEAGPAGWAAVLLDPLSRFGCGNAEGDNAAATTTVQLLERLAEVPGRPVVIMAHHSSKLARRLGQVDARGVTGLTDAARWVATLTGTDDGATLTVEKNNYAPPSEPVQLVRDEGGMLRAPSAAEQAERERHREAAAADRARADHLRVAAAAADILAMRPGLSLRSLRAELRVALGGCGHGRADAGLAVLGSAVVRCDGSRGAVAHYLDGTRVPSDVLAELEPDARERVRAAHARGLEEAS